MSAVGEVGFWDRKMDGTRLATVDLGKVLVRFEPQHADENDAAKALALDYHHQDDRRDALVWQADALRRRAVEDLAAARREIDRLRALIPPEAPLRFFGPCTARFDPAGKGVWLMNKRESGWSSGGFLCPSWDEVFRRFDAHVTGHGADDAGEYWILSNREQAKAVSP